MNKFINMNTMLVMLILTNLACSNFKREHRSLSDYIKCSSLSDLLRCSSGYTNDDDDDTNGLDITNKHITIKIGANGKEYEFELKLFKEAGDVITEKNLTEYLSKSTRYYELYENLDKAIDHNKDQIIEYLNHEDNYNLFIGMTIGEDGTITYS